MFCSYISVCDQKISGLAAHDEREEYDSSRFDMCMLSTTQPPLIRRGRPTPRHLLYQISPVETLQNRDLPGQPEPHPSVRTRNRTDFARGSDERDERALLPSLLRRPRLGSTSF